MEDDVVVGIGGLIINDRQEALLMLREGASTHNGQWSRVGGKPKCGESYEGTLHRESIEEIGADIEVGGFLNYTIDRKRPDGKLGIYLGFSASLKPGQPEPRNMEPDKCKEIRWFLVYSMPDNTADYTLGSANEYCRLHGIVDPACLI